MLRAYDAYNIEQKGGPPVHYDKDGLRILHKMDHLQADRFARAFQAARENGSLIDQDGRVHDNVEYRFYNLCCIADHAKTLGGDFVECGVYKGAASRTVCEYIGFNSLDRDFFLLDTFAGVPADSLLRFERRPVDYNKHGSYAEEARKNFRAFPRAHVIEGRLPNTLSHVKAERIAYLHVDLNALTPEIAVLELLWDRIVPGGFIISDDYGHGGHEPQRQAWDRFAESRGLVVWALPTAQGVLIKGG